jgi:hypothetical protein
MEKKIILKSDIDSVKDKFQKVIINNNLMRPKWCKDNRFELQSVDNFGSFSMIEKEDYYVSGIFIDDNGHTLIKYKIRSNITFKILCFVIPLMSLPTLIIGLKSASNKKIVSENLLLYLVITVVSIVLLLYKENALKLKGNKQFNQIISTLEYS